MFPEWRSWKYASQIFKRTCGRGHSWPMAPVLPLWVSRCIHAEAMFSPGYSHQQLKQQGYYCRLVWNCSTMEFFLFLGGGTLTVLVDTLLEMLCSLRLFLSNHCFSLPFRKCQTCFLVLRLSAGSLLLYHSQSPPPPISYKSHPAWYLLLRRLN